MKYVIGIDLGTSAVKTILVNQNGEVCAEVSKSYPLIQERSGYNEQNPEEWVHQTIQALADLVSQSQVQQIEGISYSGQMHGLVLLDENQRVLRNAILWNDTRTTPQCRKIKEEFEEQLLNITKNPVLEGFTLPKILWVKEHEPETFEKTSVFLLPKDYVRLRMTGAINSEFSDAAGTLLLNVTSKTWSGEICRKFGIPESICPPLVESHDCVGTLLPSIAAETGLSEKTKVFAGGADNACGAIGAGILSPGKTLCSIGTSGVILSHEEDKGKDFKGKVHFFNHGKADAFYAMGVTLAAGYSLSWFKETFAPEETFEQLLKGMESVPIGASGLLFTPYLVGERTPHAGSSIRGSFIGMDGGHKREHFIRAVLEGITFSLQESINLFRQQGKRVDTIISIGGGAKNETWLQMQADIFNAKVIKLKSEQGPAMGAAMLAAFGNGWFTSLEECAGQFIKEDAVFYPEEQSVQKYEGLFNLYQRIFDLTRDLNVALAAYRDQ
ncbi:xylulokinase [Fictibacillus terranigra]|uniref:Xylulose kinase n=1 Tax=Fictibacillus terranigra TaxID=3058424 RepID=A0ABT8E509_9BACL|nr:xylulokinase [Fictibacillus sp. CENA-BCM004]MDN4072979.1 xylulokinase [Fictibacillus sp. CENA-BCM004]